MPRIKFQTLLFYITVFGIFTTYISYLSLRNNANVKLFRRELDSFLHHSPKTRKDNFLAIDNSIYNNLVINTTHCKIPNFNPYDPMAVPFVHRAEWVEQCTTISYHWTYRQQNALMFNKTALTENGYTFKDLNCCYKIVTRIEQSTNHFDGNAENLIKYSDCIPILQMRTEFNFSTSTPTPLEFIMVTCSSRMVPSVVNYRAFHAFAHPHRSQITKDKINYWKGQLQRQMPPPNILVLGTDTTSRLNFQRNMIKSVQVLKQLGGVEMKGFTKSGEHTRQAMCTMLTGYSEEDLDCKMTKHGGYDNCPFIWKRLSEAHYLTAYSEDWPDMYAFGTAGFVHQPVDYYLRTLFNAAHDYGLPFPVNQFVRLSTRWCIGHQTNDQVLLDYTEALLAMADKHKTPIYAMSWSDTYPHSMDHNIVQLLDSTYADFLQRIEQKGYLNNTIVFFLSDHGQRYGPYRETLIGWYEDKLPNLWIRLPKWIREQHPEFQAALELNSNRLSSPFTFYWTVNFILDQFFPEKTNLPPPAQVVSTQNNAAIPRKFVSDNFFNEIPENVSCSNVGVPEVFCACNPLQQLQLKDPILLHAGEVALSHLNAKLPSESCVDLTVGTINGGAIIEKLGSNMVTYVVGIVTFPGEIQIEANVDYFKDSQLFGNTSTVQRANQINQGDIKCLNGDKTFELYCYCRR